jgi:hypothetical protein
MLASPDDPRNKEMRRRISENGEGSIDKMHRTNESEIIVNVKRVADITYCF